MTDHRIPSLPSGGEGRLANGERGEGARPMSPGTYLRKRREAAKLSIEIVAIAVGRDVVDRAHLRERIARAESDVETDRTALVDLIERLAERPPFAFDKVVFFALLGAWADPSMPAPNVCRTCACSWFDPCHHLGRACAWTDEHGDLCTACLDAAPPRTAPPPPSGRGAEILVF